MDDYYRRTYDDNEHNAAYKRALAAGHPSANNSGTNSASPDANNPSTNNYKQYYVEHHYHDLINDNVVNNLINDVYHYLDNLNDDSDYDQSAGTHNPCRYFRPSSADPAVCANCGRDDLDHNTDD